MKLFFEVDYPYIDELSEHGAATNDIEDYCGATDLLFPRLDNPAEGKFCIAITEEDVEILKSKGYEVT